MRGRLIDRRRFAGVLVAVLTTVATVVAACGGSDSGDDAAADATAIPATDTTSEATGTGPIATPLPGVAVTENPDGSRTITHPRGSVTLPAELPARIAVTGDPLTDSLLSLGVTPAAATADYGAAFTAHLAEGLEGVERIEWVDNGVNIEQLAAARPDLIITEDWGTPEESWGAVSQIAPTISVGDPWAATSRDVVTALGMILGLEDAAEQAIGEYEAVVADARSRLVEVVGDRSVALVLVYPDELRLVTESYGYLGPVLFGDLGLTPFGYPGDPESISPELMGDITADVVVMQPDADGTDLLTDVLEQPLVANLPAAQTDRLYVVENPVAWQTWSAVGLHANTAFVSDLLRLIAP